MPDAKRVTEAAYLPPRETSITAHIVSSICVTMSTAEMDALVNSFGKGTEYLSDIEKAVQRELMDAVYRLR